MTEYTTSQMIADMTATISQSAQYIVPCAILVGVVAFVIAWFMDSIDIAGRTFGRHR